MKQVKRTKVAIIILIFLGSVAFYFLSRVSIPRESMFLLLAVALACFLMLIFVLLLFYFKARQERMLKNREEFKLKIDYNYSFRSLVKRGRYVVCSRVITWKNFPKEETGKKTSRAFLYGAKESTLILKIVEDVLAENPSFRPANLFEIMWFGVRYPEMVKENIIVSLSKPYSFEDGSGRKAWPFLCHDNGRVEIDAYIFGMLSTKELVLFVED